MRRLEQGKRIQVLRALVEGNSMRAAARMTGAARDTVDQLLREVGQACADYQNDKLMNLPCKRFQVDEIWAYCYAKQKNVPKEKQGAAIDTCINNV